jgi:hypothetical protein
MPVAIQSRGAETLQWGKFRHHAKKKGIKVSLTKSEWLKLVKENCFYCGVGPGNKCKAPIKRGGIGDFIYQGIDRVVNSSGYAADNVVPCCKLCNSMKADFTLSTFIEHVDTISQWVLGNRKVHQLMSLLQKQQETASTATQHVEIQGSL